MRYERFDMFRVDTSHFERHPLVRYESVELTHRFGVGLLGSGTRVLGGKVATGGFEVNADIAACYNSRC